MKTNSILIIGAILLSLLVVVGWTFEIDSIEGTVRGGTLIRIGAGGGALLGAILGAFLTPRTHGVIPRFQVVSSAVLIGAATVGLLAHYTNRAWDSTEPYVTELRVKQVTKSWSGRGLLEEDLLSPPDGYFVFVETQDGLVRLFHEGGEAPAVGASRSLPVMVRPGRWGFPRYELAL